MTLANTLSDNRTVALPFPASTAVARYDLVYWDASAKRVRPLTSKTTLASEALDQAAVATTFLGFSIDQRLALESDEGATRVVGIEGICDADCPSQTFNLGDFVGPTWNGSTALANQYVTKVSNASLAIGVVIAYYAAAVTRVRFRLMSRFCWDLITSARGIGTGQGTGSKALADAAYQVLVSDPPILTQAPTVGRTITLSVEAQSPGFGFDIYNAAAAATSITVVGSSATLKGNGTIPQGKVGSYVCDGTTWYGSVSA